MWWAAKASRSAHSAATRADGFPMPWPVGDLDPGQDRAVAGLGVLQRGGELVAVQRYDPVVVVAGEDEGRRILGADLHVVQR